MKQDFHHKFCKIKEFPYYTNNEYDLLYFLGYKGSNGTLIILSQDDFVFYTDSRYFDEYQKKIGSRVILASDNLLESILSLFKEKNIQEFYINFGNTSHQTYVMLEEQAKKYQLQVKEIKQNMQYIRSIKDKKEIDYIKKAQEIVDKALFGIIGLFKEGVRANDISNELRYLIYKQGADKEAFDNMVLFGKDTAFPHGTTTNKQLKYGDAILVDVGAVYKGYCSDITRTFYFGKADTQFKESYNAVREAQENSISLIKDGVKGSFIDHEARRILSKYQLDSYFTHSLGHGVGVEIHEQPRLSKNSDDIISKGSIFSVEPGVYLKDLFGIRIEDLIFLNQHNKVEILSKIPKNLLELG